VKIGQHGGELIIIALEQRTTKGLLYTKRLGEFVEVEASNPHS